MTHPYRPPPPTRPLADVVLAIATIMLIGGLWIWWFTAAALDIAKHGWGP